MFLAAAAEPRSAGAGDLGEVLLDPDSVTVGDPIRVELRFSAPAAYRPGRVGWSTGADTLRVLDTLSHQIKDDTAWRVFTRVALFAPGRYSAGPTDLLLLGPTGDSAYVLFPPESVTVVSVLPAGQDSVAPAPYKGLVNPPARWPWWLWVALAGLVAAAAYAWHRRGRPATPARTPASSTRAPWELARERLDQLAERKHHLRGEPRPFAIELSEIMRLYLEQRFGFLALEQTTSEISAALRHVDVSEPQAEAVLRLLSGCDLAKYANFHWAAPELATALTTARRFVNDTTPQAPAPAPAPAGTEAT